MIAAVVGSRGFDDYGLMVGVLSRWGISRIVSGGAKGADSMAERYAMEKRLPVEAILPDWQRYGRAAGPMRNKEIVEKADIVFAFWDGKSRGTKSSINIAKKMGKRCEIIQY